MKVSQFVALVGLLVVEMFAFSGLAAVGNDSVSETLKDSDASAVTSSLDEVDLLVVTNQKLAPSWAKFANWKTATGRPALIVTTEDIEEQFEGEDLQAKIRECCLKHIKDKKTRWIVLGGDSSGDGGVVPDRDTDHSSCKMLPYDNIPTDLYYISETDWDANDDGKYGVFEDDMEEVSYVNPTATIGRIPVRTAEDVIAYTDKVIDYESSYPVGDFARRMVYTCAVEHAYPKLGTSIDSVTEAWPDGMISQFYSDHSPWDDAKKGDHDLTPDNWAEMINDRQASKIHIHGHGLLDCWVLEKRLVKKDCVAQLTNERAYPVITTVSCLTGQYDNKKDPCIVESMLRMPKAGAIAILAPSREGVPFMMEQSDFAKMMYEGKMDGTTASYTKFWEAALAEDMTLGEAFRKVKVEMTENARQNDGFHMCQCELNLLGDPSLPVRPTPPNNFEKLKFTCNDKLLKIRGVKEADVCLWDGKEDYQVVKTNRFGSGRIKLKSEPGEYQVAVSAEGHNIHYLPVLNPADSRGQPIAEFKKQAEKRLQGRLSEEQLDKIVGAIDRDSNGFVSDNELERQMESIQALAMKEAAKEKAAMEKAAMEKAAKEKAAKEKAAKEDSKDEDSDSDEEDSKEES